MPKVVEKRKRVVLTLKQKVDICRRLERGESRQQLMAEYGVGSSTIYDIKSQTKKLQDYMKAIDTPKAAENRHTLQYHRGEMMDKVLYEWFSLKRSEGVTITGPMLQKKGRDLAEKMGEEGACQFSDGWLHRFKVRHAIRKLDISSGKMMPLSRLVQDVRELYLGKTQPTTPLTCNAMSPRVILIRLTQKYIEKYTMLGLVKNEPLSDEEETLGDEWNMNILEPVVEISDKPKDNSRKRKGRAMQGVSRKRGRPPKVRESDFIDVSIKQEPSDPLPVPVPLEDLSHNVPMATIPMDNSTTPTLPMYQVPAGNLAVYVPQSQPLVLQHTVAVQNTNNLLINQPHNVDSPSTSDKPNQDIHSEVDLASNIKQEEQMENVFVVPFGRCLENENKSSSAKQPSSEPDIVECETPDELARKNRTAAIAASIGGMGGSSHRKLRDLTFKLVELNNKNLKCDDRIEKIKDEFKKRLQVVEIEKKGIEQEIDKVLASIQDWKDAKKQSL